MSHRGSLHNSRKPILLVQVLRYLSAATVVFGHMKNRFGLYGAHSPLKRKLLPHGTCIPTLSSIDSSIYNYIKKSRLFYIATYFSSLHPPFNRDFCGIFVCIYINFSITKRCNKNIIKMHYLWEVCFFKSSFL